MFKNKMFSLLPNLPQENKSSVFRGITNKPNIGILQKLPRHEASTKPHVHQTFEILWTNISSTMPNPNFQKT
jgi:hypothetical protein